MSSIYTMTIQNITYWLWLQTYSCCEIFGGVYIVLTVFLSVSQFCAYIRNPSIYRSIIIMINIMYKQYQMNYCIKSQTYVTCEIWYLHLIRPICEKKFTISHFIHWCKERKKLVIMNLFQLKGKSHLIIRLNDPCRCFFAPFDIIDML